MSQSTPQPQKTTSPSWWRPLSRRAFLRDGTLLLLAAASGEYDAVAAATAAGTDRPLLRVGLLTDLHYADRPPAGTRFYRETLPKIRECIARFNEIRPDFAVELGDFIDAAETAEGEIGHLKTIEAEFVRFQGARHYVLGNHCAWTLTKDEFLKNCGARKEFYSFDQGGFHFVILDACFRADGVPYGRRNFNWTDTDIPATERDWLKEDLRTAQGKTVVFVHQRLDVAGDYGVKSGREVRKVLEDSGKVLAVFQGHNHKNDLREINGIHYCTLAAMIEGSGAANSAYGILSILQDGSLRIEGFRQQKSYQLARPA